MRPGTVPSIFAALALATAGCTAAGATRRLPTPRPADVRASGSVSVFPSPGTPTASPKTTISFRGATPAQVAAVTVTGSQSGRHVGHVLAHSDGRGASFVPARAFTEGENVTVASTLAVRGSRQGTFTFTIARSAPGFGANAGPAPSATKPSKSQAAQVAHFVSRPDLRPPKVTITKNTTPAATGDIFLTPNPALGAASAAQSGPMIVDGAGNVVWFDPQPADTAFDLSVQKYDGKPVLTWFQGTVSTAGYGNGEYMVDNENYQPVAVIRAGNGYATDLHDFVITPQNTALVLAYNPVLASAALIHEAHDRVVLDAVVQEIDIRTGAVLFEWHSLGNIALSESYLAAPKSTTDAYDYVHPNSIAIDTDGNLLLSGRHTSAVYKIDRATGALDWRLGGKRSNFTIAPDARFMWQHDVRPHTDDDLSVFDNEASAPGVASRDKSRGLLLHVDEADRKVTVVRSDDNPRGALSLSQGDYQRLPDGDWFTGWGAVGEYTEFGPNDDVRLDATIGADSASYRAYRFAWNGTPTTPPTATARATGGTISIAASWNGSTKVARWQVLAGPDRSSLHAVGTFAKSGFETTMRVPAGTARVVEVQALGPAGHVLGTSTSVSVRSA